MKFDSNLAWKEASASIAANRDVLLALAGVFFLLPSLALGLLFPQPEPTAGMDQQAMMAQMSEYYLQIAPFAIPMTLIQAAGTLAMLTLFTDRRRPTVGEAIKAGIAGIVPYFLAQILLGLGIGLVGGTLIAVGAVTGSPVVTGLMIAIVGVLAIYLFIKTSLSAPVIAVEGERNPVAALKRSFALTKGNSVRLGVFYLLVGIAFLIVMMLAMGLVGIVVALIAGAEGALIANTIVSAAIGAVMTLYFVGIIAAVHRQLAGPSPDVAASTFE
ncbi:MAG: glycerophosphoryl diester phosphodiesterase membrane domain-containing protein [Novosphingobium sp.]|nr:glycerophosphoryl diester phosphodiesterase membrane domain-containing protein [Novosphingobium sp.]